MEALQMVAFDPAKRAVTRALRYALFVSVALAAVLLSMLAVATGNDRMLERYYGVLLWLNAAVGAGLLLLAVELARRLWQRYRAGLFGTRLMMRLAGVFAVMTLVPVITIYLVAVQFLGRSVESWYDVPMERALESGLTLGRASLDSLLAELEDQARRLAMELADVPVTQWAAVLDGVRERVGGLEASVLTAGGQIVAVSGGLRCCDRHAVHAVMGPLSPSKPVMRARMG
jgi:nitrogen fixation/metabolism regulation signal transduction histidine kinase